MDRPGPRFHLLIYKRLWQQLLWPSLLLIPASVLLWWYAPLIGAADRDWLALIIGGVGAVLFLFTHLSRHTAFVRCYPRYLRLQTPLYPLFVSYGRIRLVRPTQLHKVFDPQKQNWSQNRFLRPLWGRTVVVVELEDFPLPRWWLRLWFNRYLLLPDGTGFVFLVENWMNLSRQIDQYAHAWRMRRAEHRQERLPSRR